MCICSSLRVYVDVGMDNVGMEVCVYERVCDHVIVYL